MKHCRAKISILLLSILVIISLTACRSADNQTSATDNTPQSQEIPIPDSEIILFEQETPSIYQDKTVINDNSRLDLAYRPVLEEVIPHATPSFRRQSITWNILPSTLMHGPLLTPLYKTCYPATCRTGQTLPSTHMAGIFL